MEIDGEMVDHNELENIMRTSRDPEFLAHVWNGWRRAYDPAQMSQDYAEMVEIANEGARDLGFDNLAEMWLSNYDMPADEMEAEVERLWGQVEPLYEQLHCHVRANLNELYGDDIQPAEGPIRADLLGNMWAQSWAALSDVASVGDGGRLTASTTFSSKPATTSTRWWRPRKASSPRWASSPCPIRSGSGP